ncbi:hypothetical protein BC941DRAFT_506130 [Chlamydoabsidia padenii]|nr:hypothetical protein BC941DRAFT_506130 [Chlamydoabsidia padenii]
MLSIKIRAGRNFDSLQPISPFTPFHIDGPFFKGTFDLRIKGLNHPQYFYDHPNHTFSLHFHGQFFTDHTHQTNQRMNGKEALAIFDQLLEPPSSTTADDILFGQQYESPLVLPVGVGMLDKFTQWWDPGLDMHLDEDRPYAFSPLVVSFNKLHIIQLEEEEEKTDKYLKCDSSAEVKYPFEEDTRVVVPEFKQILASRRRQHYFTDIENRRRAKVGSDQVWIGDFFNGNLDMMNGTIQVPGFSINALKYYNGQSSS